MGDSAAMKKTYPSILFITQDDPFYVRIFFDEFLHRFPCRDAILGVVIAPAMGKHRFSSLLKQMFHFYGPIDFFRMGMRYALHKVGVRLPSMLRRGRSFSVEQVCRDHRVQTIYCRNINAPEFLEQLGKLNIDIIISVAAPQIFRQPLIDLPRLGCFNIHNASLPKYRGMLPNFWQMYHGEKTVGTTFHRINAQLDGGDILMQIETPIESGESLDTLIRRTKRIGARFVIEAIEQLRTGAVAAISNRREEATHFSFPTHADVMEFRRRGYRLM